ncbi:CIMIP2 protein CG18335-like [Chironomus tepperi]|uniref:CIMIP2 protein CG18335-like n=1 Tax=Chironomus tepperi TaxID=113505 RepID=UPI00391F8A01
MWRSQNHCTSKESSLNLDKLRGQHVQGLDVHCIPPYVGRCVGECDISKSKYNFPLTLVRPDYSTYSRDIPKSMLPTAPSLPYSKHTPPQWMEIDNPEKYYKSGYTGNQFFKYPHFGHTSKVDSHSALCDFTNGYQFTKSTEWAPLPFYHTSLDGDRPGTEIYPRNTGLISNYMGHVPGMKLSYGKTFGNESVNAKRYLQNSSACLH